MAGKQSAALVNVHCRWLTGPAADHWRAPRDIRLSMDDWGAIAYRAERTRPRLAA
jgi:hypothetical protein